MCSDVYDFVVANSAKWVVNSVFYHHSYMPFLSVLAPWNIIFVFFVAQYYELNARENSWCEILEFWAFLLICLIYSGLCGLWTNAYSDSEPAMFLFCCKCSPFALQRESFCTANVVHLQSNGTTFAVQKDYIDFDWFYFTLFLLFY